jgi:hypothetical protein
VIALYQKKDLALLLLFFVRNPASRLLIVLNCSNDLNGLNPLLFCSHAIYAIFYR